MRAGHFSQATATPDSLRATACSSCLPGIRSWHIYFPRIREGNHLHDSLNATASMHGKVVVITGATSGIGEVAAQGLAAMGARGTLNAPGCRSTQTLSPTAVLRYTSHGTEVSSCIARGPHGPSCIMGVLFRPLVMCLP